MPDDKKNSRPKPIKPEPDPVEEALSDLEDYLNGIPNSIPEKKAKGGLIRGTGIAIKGIKQAKIY
jgi:hypothetical protein